MRLSGKDSVETLPATYLPAEAQMHRGRLQLAKKDVTNYVSTTLSSQDPHRPARNDGPTQEHGKAIKAVADHFPRSFTVSDPEDDRSKRRENQGSTEMSQVNHEGSVYCFFPIAM